jgi:carbon-monoxide dehydrogenase medium subunit
VLRSFQIYTPESVEQASGFLAEHGADAAVYAGGTELLLAMKEGLLSPEFLVDVKHLGLGAISTGDADGGVRIGATATHHEVEEWATSDTQWTALVELEHSVANVRVRNQGTIGGNLCFGEPHADPGTLLMAWDALVEVVGPGGSRRVPVAEFLVDEFATALADGDVMTAVLLPGRPARSGSAYARFAFLERPMLGVAAEVRLQQDAETISEARVAVGAVGPRPERMTEAEVQLTGVPVRGRDWAVALSRAASHAGECSRVVSDAYGSTEYKRHVVEVLVQRALEAARTRAVGPDNGGSEQ